jgi:hypothetical protein
MGRTTLEKWKESLIFEASDIEKLIERRNATPEKLERLANIEKQLEIIKTMEKPDSITKKAKMEETG